MTPSDDHDVREEATAAALTPWQAALLLGVHLLFWVLGTPGLDLMTTMQYLTPQNREKLSQQVPAPVATAIFDLAMFNRAVRLPVVELFAPIQKPFRIAQSWHLYKDGPAKLQRLEIFVDDQLVHRSVDPGHAWLEPQLRYRRVRPMVESTVQDKDAQNWRGLSRFIVDRARRDFPDATRVELRSTITEFPRPAALHPEVQIHHRIVAAAPRWQPVVQ